MHCIKILGLVMVLVQYSRAGAIGAIHSAYSLGDELTDEYDEPYIVKKHVDNETFSTLEKPIPQINSSEKPDLGRKAENEKMNVHSHDEETDGGYPGKAGSVFYGSIARPGSLGVTENKDTKMSKSPLSEEDKVEVADLVE